MADDLDPAAVERAAVAAHDAWATHPIGPDGLSGMDLWRHIVRAALAAARACTCEGPSPCSDGPDMDCPRHGDGRAAARDGEAAGREAVDDVLNRWSTGPALAQMVVAEVRGALLADAPTVTTEQVERLARQRADDAAVARGVEPWSDDSWAHVRHGLIRDEAARDRWVAQHQADMLAAAGLLVTPEPVSVDDCLHERCADMAVDRFSPCRQQPEHDAQVAARVLREAVETANREWVGFRAVWGSEPTSLAVIDALTKALAWLDTRADLIERGEAT